MRYLSVIRKKSPTERNKTDTCPLTDSKRVHVIDPTISLVSDFFTDSRNSGLTRPPHRAHTEGPRSAYGAMKDTTALPQRPHSSTALQTQSCDVVLNMFKMIAAASHSKLWHIGHLPFWTLLER